MSAIYRTQEYSMKPDALSRLLSRSESIYLRAFHIATSALGRPSLDILILPDRQPVVVKRYPSDAGPRDEWDDITAEIVDWDDEWHDDVTPAIVNWDD